MIQDLVVKLMDNILAFMLYYFFSDSTDGGSSSTSGSGGVAPRTLDYVRQTSSFLSVFTSFLLDPSIQKILFAAQADLSDEKAFERQVRLLIAMSAVSSAGSCLFTKQR